MDSGYGQNRVCSASQPLSQCPARGEMGDEETIGLLRTSSRSKAPPSYTGRQGIGRRPSYTETTHPPPPASSKYSLQLAAQLYKEYATRQNAVLCLSVFLLVAATATERVTFKIMVDRMLPYKFVLVQIIFLFSSTTFSGLAWCNAHYGPDMGAGDMTEFPQSTIMLMAVVDTVPFLFMAFSASGVPPTMTVILMHASTIFVVLGSSVLFPSRKYTRVHHLGVGLIGLAICLCLLKATFFAGDLVSLGGYGGKGSGGYIEGSGGGWGTGGSAALSCWVFVAAACAHGLATLYKEKRIIEWGQPLDNFSLTSWLFLYQFLTTIIFSMVFYLVSALAGYGSMDALFHNLYMGWCCFLGLQDTVLGPGREDTDDALLCYESLWVIVGYVLANALVVLCMSSVLQLSNQTLGRATEAAILTAFLGLWLYDVQSLEVGVFRANEGIFDIVAIIALLAGMEVYNTDPEPDVEIITNRSAQYLALEEKEASPNGQVVPSARV